MCVHRETGAQRAVKVLRKNHMDEDEKRMLFNEINILKELVISDSAFCALSFFSKYLYYIINRKSEILFFKKMDILNKIYRITQIS